MLNKFITPIVENGYLPDSILRLGIRRLLKKRLNTIDQTKASEGGDLIANFVKAMDASPVAALPEKANEQHYELPSEFFVNSLGSHLKYSCGYWPNESGSLDDSELEALKITVERAALEDGDEILELGCGWGSLSLFMAESFPKSEITSVSNSGSQAEFIRKQASKRGFSNLTVITCDMNDFEPEQNFDRVVSVEMFEHMRNWRELFKRVSAWMKDDATFFMHIFIHKDVPYFYEDESEDDWMTRYFFSGGIMPCKSLPSMFNDHLSVEQSWVWNGEHYEKTSNAWLARMDAQKQTLYPYFESCYGPSAANKWWVRWRLFYMACAELFGYHGGEEWMVGHYRLTKRQAMSPE